jgi:hypothetical protein
MNYVPNKFLFKYSMFSVKENCIIVKYVTLNLSRIDIVAKSKWNLKSNICCTTVSIFYSR